MINRKVVVLSSNDHIEAYALIVAEVQETDISTPYFLAFNNKGEKVFIEQDGSVGNDKKSQYIDIIPNNEMDCIIEGVMNYLRDDQSRLIGRQTYTKDSVFNKSFVVK